MRIDEIHIKNFRCFEDITFPLHPHMNVVVGNNTSGKTALLHAVQIALGAYLKHLDMLKVANQYYKRNFSRQDARNVYNNALDQFVPLDENPMISAKGKFVENIENLGGAPIQQEEDIHWTRVFNYNTSDHGDMKSHVKELARVRRLEGLSGCAVMPLLASFGTKRLPDNYLKVSKSKGIETAVEKAYRNALMDTVDFNEAFDWIYEYEWNERKGLASPFSDTAFYKALFEAIPAITKTHVNIKNKRFEAEYTVTGRPSDYRTYNDMSDGFKSTIGIVADLAYRCILLNGFKGAEAVHETPGVVLIDEVDLFLHPRWQRHILQDLTNAFPKIQFIVTTHSPFIIQSVKRENVIVLDGTGYGNPENMGIEEIAEALMGMDGELRSQKYKRKMELATEYYNLVKNGDNTDPSNINEVKRRLDEIELNNDMKDDPVFAAFMKSQRVSI